MNSLLILPDELIDDETAVIKGDRYLYIQEWHKLQQGIEITVLLLGEKIGKAIVQDISQTEIVLKATFDTSPPKRLPISVVIAVPRPQTVKKILETGASIGCSKITFLRTQNVVKSYLQSKTLEEKEILLHLCRGMEQACDPVMPEVEIIDAGLSSFLAKPSKSTRVVADTTAPIDCSIKSVLVDHTNLEIELFIGPESGWDSGELSLFKENGSHLISLGDRMFRVETALAAAYGEIRASISI